MVRELGLDKDSEMLIAFKLSSSTIKHWQSGLDHQTLSLSASYKKITS